MGWNQLDLRLRIGIIVGIVVVALIVVIVPTAVVLSKKHAVAASDSSSTTSTPSGSATTTTITSGNSGSGTVDDTNTKTSGITTSGTTTSDTTSKPANTSSPDDPLSPIQPGAPPTTPLVKPSLPNIDGLPIKVTARGTRYVYKPKGECLEDRGVSPTSTTYFPYKMSVEDAVDRCAAFNKNGNLCLGLGVGTYDSPGSPYDGVQLFQQCVKFSKSDFGTGSYVVLEDTGSGPSTTSNSS